MLDNLTSKEILERQKVVASNAKERRQPNTYFNAGGQGTDFIKNMYENMKKVARMSTERTIKEMASSIRETVEKERS